MLGIMTASDMHPNLACRAARWVGRSFLAVPRFDRIVGTSWFDLLLLLLGLALGLRLLAKGLDAIRLNPQVKVAL